METPELNIDFVAHGDDGPMSRWASHAKLSDFLGFAWPSAPKVIQFEAGWYLVAFAALEAMPRNAKGLVIFEATSAEDWQNIEIPDGIDVHWLA